MNKKVTKKKKKVLNIFFNIMGLISTIIMLIFCYCLYKLNMIPTKFLYIIYGALGIIYLIMILITLPPKVKVSIKTFCLVLFIILGTIFGFANKYIFDTMDFMSILDKEVFQKERYAVMVLNKSGVKSIEELNGKSIASYKSSNSEKAIEELNKKVKVDNNEFSDVEKMFESLENGEVSAVVVSSSVEKLLDSELKDMNLDLKTIYEFKISIKKEDIVKVVNVTNTPFNVYIAGGDGYGSIDITYNTDVNMIATIDPVNRKILLTSIPRDYWVNLVGQGPDAYDKLTHAGYYGIQESVKDLENLLDIDINYYVKVNFSTIEGIVDAIGGVDVYSDYDFYENAFGIYHFVEGNNHLNGKQALAFARERKAFGAGDLQRVKDQQKVVEAIINKMTSSTALISGYEKILNSVSENLDTNMSSKDIQKLVKMQLNDMRGWSVESQNPTGTTRYGGTYTFPTMTLYSMVPDSESLNQTKLKIKKYLGE